MPIEKTNGLSNIKHIISGFAVSIVVTLFIMVLGGSTLFGELLLRETLPQYRYNQETLHNGMMAILPSWSVRNAILTAANPANTVNTSLTEATHQNPATDVFAQPQESNGLIGIGDVAFNYRNRNTLTAYTSVPAGPFILPAFAPRSVTPHIYDSLWSFTYFRNNYYSIEPDTDLLPRHVDMERFFNAELRIEQTDMSLPTVLIFHTHSSERFIDSDPNDPWTGIMGVGAYLQQVLSGYGIVAIHETSRFDIVDGRVQILGSYERMEPVIRQVLAENPTIEIIIDLHRDGVRGDHKFLTYIDDIPVARIMYVNGLTLQRRSGELQQLTNLYNPYLMENMIFSFNMQMMSNELFPGLNRRMLLKPFRYSTHMRPNSLLVEVGNQNNTLQEAKNAMHLFARVLAHVILD